MPSGLAAVVCAAGILGLFLLDRDRTSRTSPALWVPAAWLGIAASRDISQWFNTVLVTDSPDQLLEGSPVDRVIYAGLLVAGLVVLVSRAERARSLLRANWPLVVFFLFCAISVLWSDYPFVAFKRWTKALGNLVMVLVVLTERDPPAAVRQLLTRTGFLLIPLSVLLIKYFPQLGRQFSPWGGMAYSSGVAIGKNGLGILCLVLGLGSLWRFLAALPRDERPRMARPLIAHGVVLAMASWLFWAADSATSLGCFLIAALLLGLTSRYGFARRPMVVSPSSLGSSRSACWGSWSIPTWASRRRWEEIRRSRPELSSGGISSAFRWIRGSAPASRASGSASAPRRCGGPTGGIRTRRTTAISKSFSTWDGSG